VYNQNIRCAFSPLQTTGSRYLTTGSANASIHFFDTYTGDTLMTLSSDKLQQVTTTTVKEVSWHPRIPVLTSTTLEGTLNIWTLQNEYDDGLY
jgi:WD40 repeat protein